MSTRPQFESNRLESSKPKAAGYWIATGLLAFSMALTALVQDFPRGPQLMQTLSHLGYPTYFPFLTGTAKLLGAAVLVVPRYPVLKEWAYAGFTILFGSAIVSHLASGDGLMAAAPLVMLAVLGASYFTRPIDRRVAPLVG